MKDWEAVSELFMQQLGKTERSRLAWQLDIWGYYKEEIALCETLIGKSKKDSRDGLLEGYRRRIF